MTPELQKWVAWQERRQAKKLRAAARKLDGLPGFRPAGQRAADPSVLVAVVEVLRKRGLA